MLRPERDLVGIANRLVVAPYRATDTVGGLPLVAGEDVRVQVGVGVAEDLVGDPPELRIQLAAALRRGAQPELLAVGIDQAHRPGVVLTAAGCTPGNQASHVGIQVVGREREALRDTADDGRHGRS